MTNPTHLAQLLRTRREALGLSQLQVATAVGYRYAQNISNYESGARTLPLDKFRAVAQALDLPVSRLVEAHVTDIYLVVNQEVDNG